MSEQLEELEDARRMAGEAQMELQKYKERFESFVPAKDFDLMKEHSGAELVTFQNENRRLRRTAAARSTQVDVLNRKLLDLESVKNDLVGNKGDKVLTPRPNWDAIRKAMPTLAEYSKDDHCLPMDKGEDGDDGVVDTAELTTVGGPSTTVLQVEFLLETIEALKRRVAELESENATMTKVASDDKLATSGSTKLKRPNVEKAYDCNTIIPILGAGIHASIPKHLQICGAVERVAMPMELRVKIIFDFFVELQQPVMEAASIEDVNVPVHFYNFLEAEVVTSEDVRNTFRTPRRSRTTSSATLGSRRWLVRPWCF
ncbi:hypothetical protein AGDE_13254 [Angomonas deanei]|uniref:Uncharacterized protein n=1 Tax=Angomonas deanei TaxID=59799 RepID=A0A7G2CFA3_9TRYP|nr:hypothetical protein AGDE_13254 [Angomonas deanei]CAD2218015.1 hypothetical protein, conserved [Angomonas deanei]|eukprot:EPY22543.1 hypothetical protein AGDE_13254 [Angomonas deanei]